MQGLAVAVAILHVIPIILAVLQLGVFNKGGQEELDLDIKVIPAGRKGPLPGYAKPALVAVRARR